MHKWNMFRRTAPVVLSLVVAATSMPVTAADFGGGAVTEAETAEAAGEEIEEADLTEAGTEVSEESIYEAEEETAGEVSEETEAESTEPDFIFDCGEEAAEEADAVFADAASAEEGTVTVAGTEYSWKKSAADGYTQIGESGVYYQGTLPAGDYYGTAALSYREFYNGDVTNIAGSQYDAYASATSSKYSICANEDTTVNYEYDENGEIKTKTQMNSRTGEEETVPVISQDANGYYYYINGVKNVSVKVSAAVYVQAKILEAAGTLNGAAACYTEAAGITLNASPAAAVEQYKTLNEDGTWSATTFKTAATVTDAEAALETSSRWGDYVVEVKETSTSYIRTGRSNEGFAVNGDILGVIVKASDGTAVGLRHCYEIWVQPWKVAFDKSCGLEGKTITEIDYIMPNATYVYTFAGVYVKPQTPDAVKTAVTASAVIGSNQAVVTGLTAFTNPKISVYWVEGSGRNSKTTYLAEEAAVTVQNGTAAVTLNAAAEEGKEYTVKLISDNYADVTTTAVLKAAPTATPTPTVKPSITVKKTVINLALKKTTTLKPTVKGVSGKVTYTSSNKKVATVSSKGKITAKKTGKATITIKCGSVSKKVTVYVNEKLTLKKSSASIKVKGKTTIKATTNIKGTITYTSSNKKVATVSSKGVVKGVKKGTATITVKCNGVTKKFKVRVK